MRKKGFRLCQLLLQSVIAIEINYKISDMKSCNNVGTLPITSLLLNPFLKKQTLAKPKMNCMDLVDKLKVWSVSEAVRLLDQQHKALYITTSVSN